jgi:hypothetical protein
LQVRYHKFMSVGQEGTNKEAGLVSVLMESYVCHVCIFEHAQKLIMRTTRKRILVEALISKPEGSRFDS